MKYVKEFQLNDEDSCKDYVKLLNDENIEITSEHKRTDKYNNFFITVWYQDKEF